MREHVCKASPLISLLALAALAVAAPVAATTYAIDTVHTSVGFSVKHLGISNVRGSFGEFSGSFDFDPADPKVWGVEATVQVNSIDTGNERRDNHLRSPDFFDAANHPTMTLRSKGVKALDGGRHQLMGDLTIRGVTKPVVFDLELVGTGVDPQGNQRAGFSATTTINRQDFGLAWNKALETGGVVVANEVKITIDAEGVAQK